MKIRKTLITIGITALLLTGCAQAGQTPVANEVPAATVINAADLDYDGGWSFTDGPSEIPEGIVSSDVAIENATTAVQGFHLTKDAQPITRLVHWTSIEPGFIVTTDDEINTEPQYDNKLVWVVQLRNVTLWWSPGRVGGEDAAKAEAVAYEATIQWVMDAATGEYLMARDFGTPK